MTIPELHKALHPKFGPYIGPENKYSHRIGNDMSLSINKQDDGGWAMAVFERGQKVSESTFPTEDAVCEAAYAFAKES